MSRFILISSLVFGLSSLATADRASAQFAKPPQVAAIDVNAASTASAELRIAPRRVLDRATVRAALVRARAANLAGFRAYQKKGVFPNNTFKSGKLNVWLDELGNFCAAATLIKLSGQDELASRTAEQNNFIRLADVKQGPLMDWILMSGFTQAEIVAIQEPFMPVTDLPGEPEPILANKIDDKLRQAEDARLRARYRAVDKMLVRRQAASLELATTRLMKNTRLAWQLVGSQAG